MDIGTECIAILNSNKPESKTVSSSDYGTNVQFQPPTALTWQLIGDLAIIRRAWTRFTVGHNFLAKALPCSLQYADADSRNCVCHLNVYPKD